VSVTNTKFARGVLWRDVSLLCTEILCRSNKVVVLKIEPNVRIRTPIRELSESVVQKFKELPLADDRFHRPPTISLILGADVYPKVIQPGFHMVDEGPPVAQKTVFGWILSGACTQA